MTTLTVANKDSKLRKLTHLPIHEVEVRLESYVVPHIISNDDRPARTLAGVTYHDYDTWEGYAGRDVLARVNYKIEISEQHFTIPTIVHEATHAALDLVDVLNYKWKKLKGGEKYGELLPILIETFTAELIANHTGEPVDYDDPSAVEIYTCTNEEHDHSTYLELLEFGAK